jgi:hypothetical protein
VERALDISVENTDESLVALRASLSSVAIGSENVLFQKYLHEIC